MAAGLFHKLKFKTMNMSYCRFENTLADLQDCLDALRQNGSIEATESEADQYEKPNIRALVELCREVYEEFGDELQEG